MQGDRQGDRQEGTPLDTPGEGRPLSWRIEQVATCVSSVNVCRICLACMNVCLMCLARVNVCRIFLARVNVCLICLACIPDMYASNVCPM